MPQSYCIYLVNRVLLKCLSFSFNTPSYFVFDETHMFVVMVCYQTHDSHVGGVRAWHWRMETVHWFVRRPDDVVPGSSFCLKFVLVEVKIVKVEKACYYSSRRWNVFK